MKVDTQIVFPEKKNSPGHYLRVILVPQGEAEKAILSMALNECPQVTRCAHDPDSVYLDILLDRQE